MNNRCEVRQVQESPIVQGESEKLTFTLTVTPWGSNPSSPIVTMYDITEGVDVDVSDDTLVGSPVVEGDVISLPSVENLTAGRVYRLEIQWISGGNTFECYCIVEAER